MNILITGLPISGKSHFRQHLFKLLQERKRIVFQMDADNLFYRKNQPILMKNSINLIEDVRGLLSCSVFLISSFNLVIYVHPDLFSHLLFIFMRIWNWFASGHIDLRRETGWEGTKVPSDLRNAIPILKKGLYYLRHIRKWRKEDTKSLKNISAPVFQIKSRWRNGCIEWSKDEIKKLLNEIDRLS